MPRRQCWGPVHVVRLLSTKPSPAFTFFFSFLRYEPWARHAGGLLTTSLLGAFRPEIHITKDIAAAYISIQIYNLEVCIIFYIQACTGHARPLITAGKRLSGKPQNTTPNNASKATEGTTCNPKASCSKCIQHICPHQPGTTY